MRARRLEGLLSARTASGCYIVTALLLKCSDDLEAADCPYLERLTTTNSALAAAYRFSQRLALMVWERQDDRLGAWLTEVEGREVVALRRFAQGPRRDLAAIRAGLREVWSNGMTEGFANKLKSLKRQGYGRAGFPVLRQRMLRAAQIQHHQPASHYQKPGRARV